MDKTTALSYIQKMHETKCVTRESVIAWYHFYSHSLPKMFPERSDIDLIRTISLWMELTDKGGNPKFPFDYRSQLNFAAIDLATPAKLSKMFPVQMILLLTGIIVVFFNWIIGTALILLGPLLVYFEYKLEGGATNPDLIKENSSLYRYEARRVLEWSQQYRDE